MEAASEDRPHPEQLEIARGDNFAGDDVGACFGRHDPADHGMRGEPFEGLGLLLDIEKVRIGRREMREFFGLARVDLHEATRVLDGKLLEKDRVHDAEDGRIQSDPEGERKRRHEGKAWLTDERPQRVSNIACEILHFVSVFRWCYLLTAALGVFRRLLGFYGFAGRMVPGNSVGSVGLDFHF